MFTHFFSLSLRQSSILPLHFSSVSSYLHQAALLLLKPCKSSICYFGLSVVLKISYLILIVSLNSQLLLYLSFSIFLYNLTYFLFHQMFSSYLQDNRDLDFFFIISILRNTVIITPQIFWSPLNFSPLHCSLLYF